MEVQHDWTLGGCAGCAQGRERVLVTTEELLSCPVFWVLLGMSVRPVFKGGEWAPRGVGRWLLILIDLRADKTWKREGQFLGGSPQPK